MATVHPLAAQAVSVRGDERTFDEVPLLPGNHIRWSFAPELGFPPYGFWLFRRALGRGDTRFPPPVMADPQYDQAKLRAAASLGGLRPGGIATGELETPVWLGADANGWSPLSQIITIPLTLENWPARYPGALDPSVTPPVDVRAQDIAEATRRLRLAPGAAPKLRVEEVRAELGTLVAGFPKVKLFDVPSEPVPDGAPGVGLTPMRRLLLFALNPHMARVLGLSYVDMDIDTTSVPRVEYMYYVMGVWLDVTAASDVFTPGLGLPQALARGASTMDGATLSSPLAPAGSPVPGAPTSWFWRWLRDVDPHTDAATPAGARDALAALTFASGSPAPAALLVAQSAYSAPGTVCRITFRQPVMQVEVQIAGHGAVQALAGDTPAPVGYPVTFDSSALTPVTVTAPSGSGSGSGSGDQPISAVDISVTAPFDGPATGSMFVIVGAVTAHLLAGDHTGNPGAQISSIHALIAPAAPGQPNAFFRGRRAEIDESGPAPALAARSTFEVQWPAPALTAADVSGDPIGDPLMLPAPTRAVGFIAERFNAGGGAVAVGRDILAASQPRTGDTPPGVERIYRLIDGDRPDPAPDPAATSAYHVAGYNLFGARGDWSDWSNGIAVERLAVAPTATRVRRFSNSGADGGAPNRDGSAWVGSKLTLDMAWSGGALVDYPDTRSARVRVTALDTTPEEVLEPPLDLAVTPLAPLGGMITGVTYDSTSHIVSVTTNPAFPAMDTAGQPGLLITAARHGGSARPNWERFTALAVNTAEGVVTVFPAGSTAHIVTTPGDYIGRAAYLIRPFATTVTLHPPLVVPAGQPNARAAVDVLPSIATPFNPFEQVIDPNGRLPPRSPTPSERVIVVGQQWLTPPQPAVLDEGPSGYTVNHRYYDPADFNGVAGGRIGAFSTAATPGVKGVMGYQLMRTPVETLALADIERLLKRGGMEALAPTSLAGGSVRQDLSDWLATYGDWLASYNAWVKAENARRGRRGLEPLAIVDATTALTDDTARRAFVEHFYGSLLDDELRALGNLSELKQAYTRAALDHIAPGDPITDSVDGKGAGRMLYRLKSINEAGGESDMTNCAGPYYLRPVAPPPAPGWLQAAPAPAPGPVSGERGVSLAWPCSASPDIAGYLVYRAPATSADDLDDLRYFGPDWAHPLEPERQPRLVYTPTSRPALSFERRRDPRIVAVAADPRLFARDYEGSDMAEVTLPAGLPGDVTATSILGVYRLDRFNPDVSPITSQSAAFNYYVRTGHYTADARPAGSRSARVVESARVVGLRVGLGGSVPVVVIVDTGGGGGPVALGTLPVYGGGRAAVVTYQDESAAMGETFTYSIVAVDTWGNRSAPSPRASGTAS